MSRSVSCMYHNSCCLFFSRAAQTATDEDDNTKEETAKMLREYENLKDSTKDERTPAEDSECQSAQRDEIKPKKEKTEIILTLEIINKSDIHV